MVLGVGASTEGVAAGVASSGNAGVSPGEAAGGAGVSAAVAGVEGVGVLGTACWAAASGRTSGGGGAEGALCVSTSASSLPVFSPDGCAAASACDGGTSPAPSCASVSATVTADSADA